MTTAWDLVGRYATDVLTDEAVRIIQGHDVSSLGPPLFLYLAHLAVHSGNRGKFLEAPQPEIDKFTHIIDPNRKTYAGNVNPVYHKPSHNGMTTVTVAWENSTAKVAVR